jgi:RNA polymerase sporulation-specific sigma factor
MIQKLIEDNMGLVYWLINRYYPTFIADEDVVQCGMLGLCRAAHTFDENYGVNFSSYASKCIWNEISRELSQRMKHSTVISLDTRKFDDDGDSETLVDFVEGESDIDFDSVNYGVFYEKLSSVDKDIVKYKQLGLTGKEISEILGLSRQSIHAHLRKLRRIWRETNAN